MQVNGCARSGVGNREEEVYYVDAHITYKRFVRGEE
jgi:hypothetical protein